MRASRNIKKLTKLVTIENSQEGQEPLNTCQLVFFHDNKEKASGKIESPQTHKSLELRIREL